MKTEKDQMDKVFLRKGTVVKINGIPLLLAGDVEAKTAKGNLALIKQLTALSPLKRARSAYKQRRTH